MSSEHDPFLNLPQIRVPHISRFVRDVGNEAALNRQLFRFVIPERSGGTCCLDIVLST
jgi:hypothetical protein